ncbi:MAG: hypothetical protein HYZ53_01535 [Planctomycetes bacterium]|nr:hypothetical protein [Planctomycetota bacterium]
MFRPLSVGTRAFVALCAKLLLLPLLYFLVYEPESSERLEQQDRLNKRGDELLRQEWLIAQTAVRLDVQKAVREAGVVGENLARWSARGGGTRGALHLTGDLTVSGAYEGIAKFLKGLTEVRPALSIDELELRPEPRRGPMGIDPGVLVARLHISAHFEETGGQDPGRERR